MRFSWKRVLMGAGALLLAAVFAAAGAMYDVYHTAKHTAERIYEPRKPSAYSRVQPVAALREAGSAEDGIGRTAADSQEDPGKRPFTVLLLGVDRRPGDKGRSDTICVLSVNPRTQTISLLAIPRDTRTEIVGRGTEDKINHAYAFGGVDMSVQTVEKFLGFPMDYYVKVDMEEFSRIIDTLGGVEVDNPFPFTIEGKTFGQGRLKLTGEDALLFTRMRHDDPRGDLGRNARQRELIASLMGTSVRFANLLRTDAVFKRIEDSVRTDMKFDFIQSCLYLRLDRYALKTTEIRGSGSMMGGIWYYIVNDREKQRVHDWLENSLNA